MNLIDAGEQRFRAAHGRFTGHLADLLTAKSKLADDLAIGLGVQLDVSSDGQTFYAQVAGDVLSLVRARTGRRLKAESCLILKSGSGVHCPTPGSFQADRLLLAPRGLSGRRRLGTGQGFCAEST